MTRYLLGIDGGGSKTRAAVADSSGAILGTGQAAASNYQVVGIDAAVEALSTAIEGALAAAGLNATQGAFDACFGLSGADRPADIALLSERIGRWGTLRRFRIVNDAELVLAAASPDRAAVALISGTGSICLGRGKDGTLLRAGGWGYILGDEGSGYDLGIRTLRLATRTADGRSCAAEILRAVLAFWRLTTPEDLIPFAYARGTTRAEIAELAGLTLRLAEQGDAQARALVEETAVELALQVDTVAGRLELRRPPLALGGGLLRGSAMLRELVLQRLRTEPGAVTVVHDPVQGALGLAQRLLE